MDLKSFVKNEDGAEEEASLGENEKKIEFAQKLPREELEGAPASRGGTFDFLKGPEARKEGEAVAVSIHEGSDVLKDELAEESAEIDILEKGKMGKWLDKIFKPKIGGQGVKKLGREKKMNFSRALDVNLVKGEIVKFFDWQRAVLVLLVSVFASLTILSLVYWGISWWGTNKQSVQNSAHLQEYYQVNKTDKSAQVKEVLKFKEKLDAVDFLLARHIYWTNFFTFLENNTLSNVYFSGFSGGIASSYSLGATTDSLDAINAQIKMLLASPNVTSATVGAGSIGGSDGKPVVTFSLAFGLDPKIFFKK